MPAVFQKTVEQDLHKPLKIQYCADTVFTKDNAGNQINVLLFEDGEPYSSGGTVSATAIRADGATETLPGTISGNTVSVALTQAALDVPGTLQVFVKVTAGTVKTTVYAGVYNVVCTETPTVVAPVTPSDVAALIASIEAAIRNIPADWTSFLGTIAPTFDPGKADGYAAGAYVWYPGQPDNVGTLYRFTSAHSGTWTGTDVVTAVIGNELNDTVRYTQQIKTDAEKTIARANIGAASNDGLYSLASQVSGNTTDIDVIQRTIGSGLDPNNTIKSQLDGIKADIGTVPDGQNLQGEVSDLKSAIEQIEPGLSDNAKAALLNCFQHVAWTDEHGQDYFDALEDALYSQGARLSAVFSQSTEKYYPFDNLNVLKDNLVVTYTNEQGQSSVVNNYTLSGSLSVGRSSITVGYNGLTAYFTVNVENIPVVKNVAIGMDCSTDAHWYAMPSSPISARCRFDLPVKNRNYTVSVVDSTKYNIAGYNLVSNSLVEYQTGVQPPTEEGYLISEEDLVSWATSVSFADNYLWCSFKKMDGTDFTQSEIDNAYGTIYTVS